MRENAEISNPALLGISSTSRRPMPKGLSDATNPYAYAADSPVMYTDPLGLAPYPTIDPDVHLATVDMARAAMLFEQQRYDEALPFARKAAEVFAERRDLKRYFDAKEWEALILHRLGDVVAARATYKAAYDMADAAEDVEMKARAANNLGIAYHALTVT